MQAACAPRRATRRGDVDPAVGASQCKPPPANPVEIVEVVDDGACDHGGEPVTLAQGGYLLILQLEGESEVEQGGAKVLLRALDLLLLDARLGGRLRSHAKRRQLHVYLGDAPACQRLGWRHPPPLGVIRGTGGLAIGLRCLILAIRRIVAQLTHEEQRGLRSALFDLAVAAVRAEPCPMETRMPLPRPGLRRLALLQESVDNRLSDPGLCPAHIAAEHGISTRQLHRLFKQTGMPFGAYVRRRRLERCRDDLADPRLRPLPMTEIAFRWGFSDSAHFSRCFRAAFGCTARDFRAGLSRFEQTD